MEPANPANAANPAQLEKPGFVMGSKSGPFQRENGPFWHFFLPERSRGVLEGLAAGPVRVDRASPKPWRPMVIYVIPQLLPLFVL